MKKTGFVLFLLLAAALALSACGNGAKQEDSAPAATSAADTAAETTAPLSPEELRASLSDGLPDKNFDGRKFTVISETYLQEYYVAEDLTGETFNDAIFERNSRIGERFNVKVDGIFPDSYKTTMQNIETAVLAGDTSLFDLCAPHMVQNAAVAIEGYYLNWYDLPFVDFEQPWWAPGTREELTVNGKTFVAVGDMAQGHIPRTWVYLYNKQLWDSFKLGDPYELVRDGKWTIGKVEEIIETAFVDANGDGAANEGDTFGFASWSNSECNTYMWAFDNPVIRKDAGGKPVIAMYSQHYVDVMNKILEFFNNKHAFVVPFSDTKTWQYEKAFDVNKAVLVASLLTHLREVGGTVPFDIGVLPFPKFDEAQEDYHTMVDGGAEMLCVPIIAPDLEFVGVIAEAMCAESYKFVTPALYEVTFKMRYADMQEDADMMDLIMDSRSFDIGYVYDNWKGASFWPVSMVRYHEEDIASYYATNWPAAEKHYETVLKLFNG